MIVSRQIFMRKHESESYGNFDQVKANSGCGHNRLCHCMASAFVQIWRATFRLREERQIKENNARTYLSTNICRLVSRWSQMGKVSSSLIGSRTFPVSRQMFINRRNVFASRDKLLLKYTGCSDEIERNFQIRSPFIRGRKKKGGRKKMFEFLFAKFIKVKVFYFDDLHFYKLAMVFYFKQRPTFWYILQYLV